MPYSLIPALAAFIYFLLSTLWVFCSAQILTLLGVGTPRPSSLQTFENLGIITVGAILLYLMVGQFMNRLERATARSLRSELALAESEARYRLLAENASDVVWLYDLTAGHFTYLSPSGERLIGFTPAEALTMGLRQILPPASADRAERELARYIAAYEADAETTRSFKLEVDLLCKSGALVPVEAVITLIKEADGRVRRAMGISRDISERRQAMAALHAREQQISFLADTIEKAGLPIAIGYPDGRLGFVNPAFCELTGYSMEELKSVTRNNVLKLPEWVDIQLRILAEMERSGTPVRFEKEYIRKDGRRIPIELQAYAVKDAAGKMQYYYAFITDITARRQAEEVLRQSNLRLERSEAQLRTLATHLAQATEQESKRIARKVHDDLGQIVTVLQFDLQRLRGKLSPEDGVQADLQEMLAHTDQADEVIRQIVHELRPALLDDLGLVAAIRQHLAQCQAKSGVRYELVSPDHIATDIETATVFFRILQEATTNIARHARATLVQVMLAVQDERLSMIIKDNGLGITLKQATSRASFGITGMRERILSLGGTIDIQGEPGRGTTILVAAKMGGKQ